MRIGIEGHPKSMKFEASVRIAAATYRKWFDVGRKLLKLDNPSPLKINKGFSYLPKTAAEYSKLKYTPWTYYERQTSRPYNQWVSAFRGF